MTTNQYKMKLFKQKMFEEDEDFVLTFKCDEETIRKAHDGWKDAGYQVELVHVYNEKTGEIV